MGIWSTDQKKLDDEDDEGDDDDFRDKVIEELRKEIRTMQAAHMQFLHDLVMTLVMKSQEKPAVVNSPALQRYLDKKATDNGVKQTGKAP